MKTYIIEETFSTTYFHKVQAESPEEAREKFYNDEDVEYNFNDPFYGDDALIEVFEEKDY